MSILRSPSLHDALHVSCDHDVRACDGPSRTFTCEAARLEPLACSRAIHAEDASVLEAIHEPGLDLAIWRRALPASLQAWLEDLENADTHLDLHLLAHPDDLRRALADGLTAQDVPSDGAFDAFIADIVDVARHFHRLASHSRAEPVDIRLETVFDNACAKFHRDKVQARLLTTYWGRGTQWVSHMHRDDALRLQTAFDGPLEHLSPGDVAIFRGDDAVDGAGVVHRSPPIAGTGETRLLLCVNRPSSISPPAFRTLDAAE